MKRVTSIATACVAAVILAVGVSVGAQDLNTQEKTFLTFSNSVELPGITLPAGTYTFKLADTQSRNVVQVLSQDEKQIHGQFLFIQAERLDVTGETVITFRETREGATPAVQYRYYPGEKIGKEFIYPKDQATAISARTGATVMTEGGPIERELHRELDQLAGTGDGVAARADHCVRGRYAGAGCVGHFAAADRRAPQPNPPPTAEPARPAATVAAAEPAPAPPADVEPAPVGTSGVQDARPESVQARAELPRTASPLALSGLIGLLSLAGAMGLRAFRG